MQNKIKMVAPTNQIPHGVKYPLTLHDKNNTRITDDTFLLMLPCFYTEG